jgi:predicted HAD superfamily Cof-like phosphohydrolase
VTNFDDVIAFQRKAGRYVADRPVRLTDRRLAEKANAMLEELHEFAIAAGLSFHQGKFIPDGCGENDLAEQADGLVDLVYFALGTAAALGLDWQKHWDEVQRANMLKERGVNKDMVKLDGWVGPNHNKILGEGGYNPDAVPYDDPENKR